MSMGGVAAVNFAAHIPQLDYNSTLMESGGGLNLSVTAYNFKPNSRHVIGSGS